MKQQIIAAIRAHIMSRPNIDSRDYGNIKIQRADQRKATKDAHAALAFLGAISARDDITAAAMLDPARNTGRFSIKQDGQTIRADYCTGQYWPTEYRAGAARYLADVLWNYLREQDHAQTGHDLRKRAAGIIGAPLARRFYN